jgi:hypothetical protein
MWTRHRHNLELIACLSAVLAVLGAGCRQPPKKQVSIVDGVEVVINPAVPLHRDPGRILKVEERLRIRDVGDAFYFKSPQLPEIAPDGSVLLRDFGQQLLRFSTEGTFLGNLVKPGQGPGEIQMLFGYFIEGDEVYAADGAGNKVVHMTLDGRYLDERRVDGNFVTMTRGWLVSLRSFEPQVQGVLADAKHEFSWTSRSDGSLRKTYTFLGKYYRNARIRFHWDTPRWVADAERDLLFITLSRDYGIQVLNLNAGRIIRSFNRAYPKVALGERAKKAYEQGGGPRPDYELDVLELFLADGSLWVRTSTVDPKKGQLFDVFSLEGDFLDSFFVPFKDNILGLRGDTIFVRETADDGTIAVVLYRNLEYGKG